MTTVLVFNPDGNDGWLTELELPEGDTERLRILQAAVGGYIELVRANLLANATEALWMFCNEEGRAQGLQPNVMASTLAQTSVVGPVVFHGGADANGELVSCPEAFRRVLWRLVAAQED